MHMADGARALLRPGSPINGVCEARALAYYHPARAGHQDSISNSLRKFTAGEEPDTSRWVEASVPRIAAEFSFDVVVRVLGAGETFADAASPLDRIGRGLEASTSKAYEPIRLRKRRATRSFEEVVGREARRKELHGVYTFDPSGLRNDSTVLVLDTLWSTGSTLEAVASAVHAALPEATVVAFVLGRADATSQNEHLNPDYFTGAAERPDSGVASREEEKSRRRVGTVGAEAGNDRPAGNPQSSAGLFGGRISWTTTMVAGIGLFFLLLGALVPLHSVKKPPADPDPLLSSLALPEEPPPAAKPAEPAPVRVEPVKPKAPPIPAAVVTVPNIGIRKNHSLDAGMVPKVSLKEGEVVGIVKRYKPASGPGWVQVRTRSGKTGWVFAAVLKEKKVRG